MTANVPVVNGSENIKKKGMMGGEKERFKYDKKNK